MPCGCPVRILFTATTNPDPWSTAAHLPAGPDTRHRTPDTRPPRPCSLPSAAPEPNLGAAKGPGDGRGPWGPRPHRPPPQPLPATFPLEVAPQTLFSASRSRPPSLSQHPPVQGLGLAWQGDPRTHHVLLGRPELWNGGRDSERRPRAAQAGWTNTPVKCWQRVSLSPGPPVPPHPRPTCRGD